MSTTDFSDNGYTARFLASRESRINRNISRHILPLSLLTSPILWAGTQTGAFYVSDASLIILFAASAVFTLAAYLLASRRLLDPAVKYIELTAAALLIFFMSFSKIWISQWRTASYRFWAAIFSQEIFSITRLFWAMR